MSLDALKEKIDRRSAVVGIVGLGYVGLPLMIRFVESGFSVVGFDTDPEKVSRLNDGKSYIRHIDSSRIAEARTAGFEARLGVDSADEADVLIICVPTPLNAHREPDLGFVVATLDGLRPRLRSGQMLSLESTTYPGTTEEEIVPRVEDAGLTVGSDVFVVYSPEREDPGNREFTTGTIPKVVSGVTAACREAGLHLYRQIVEQVVEVSTPATAEMTKLLENIHRAVNIGLVNELKTVADKMGIDIHEVIRAAATKPFGFVPYFPGPGLGGHCIPIDPFYLTWKAREYGVSTRFIELAGEVNTDITRWVVVKLADALNNHGKPVNGSRVLMLGVAYKKNIDDTRESASLELLRLLDEKGAVVDYSDPYVPELGRFRKYDFEKRSVDITAESLANYDCVLVATDHDAFDYDLIQAHASLIIDTRGRYDASRPNVVRA